MVFTRNRLLLPVFLLLVLNFSSVKAHEKTFCRDGDGTVVDWWVMYKEAGSMRYVYLSSRGLATSNSQTFTQKLSKDREINDPNSSPFLRTVYGSLPLTKTQLAKAGTPENKDNRMILAWNDQQPHGGKRSTSKVTSQSENDISQLVKKHIEEMELVDPNLLEIKLGKGKDMYGWGETEEFAHSKGLIGLSVVDIPKGGTGDAMAEFYFISHSFPRTPNGQWNGGKDVPVRRTHVHPDPKKFFGTNITGSQSKAQHAICISMQQKVQIEREQILFNRNNLDNTKMNLFSLLNGLGIIGPSLTLTNYVPWMARFCVYNQLFGVKDDCSWTEASSRSEQIKNLNIARVKPQNYTERIASDSGPTHAFPLWPTTSRVKISIDGGLTFTQTKTKKKQSRFCSLRNPHQVFLSRCRVWNADSSQDSGCFFSARLTSTARDGKPLEIDLDFKHPLVRADTDDIIAARLIPKEDYILANDSEKRTPSKKYVSIVVVTQSWYDYATLGSRARDVIDTEKLRVRVWFEKNLAVKLPVENGSSISQASNGLDHSKWFVTYLYGQLGSFLPVAGFMDLNRNNKATQLLGRNYGRGGMLLSFTRKELVTFLMELSPIIENTSNFTNLPIDYFMSFHPLATKTPPLAQVTGFNNDGTGIKIKFEDEEEFLIRTPFCKIPTVATIFASLNGQTCETSDSDTSTAKTKPSSTTTDCSRHSSNCPPPSPPATPKTPKSRTLSQPEIKFLIGTPGFSASPFTPIRLTKPPIPSTSDLSTPNFKASFTTDKSMPFPKGAPPHKSRLQRRVSSSPSGVTPKHGNYNPSDLVRRKFLFD